MASEDSRKREGWTIHRLGLHCDLPQAVQREVSPRRHQAHDVREDLEVSSLCRSQWVCFEEGNDARNLVIEGPDPKVEQIFPVVVMPSVTTNLAATKKLLQLCKTCKLLSP
jgi:hypothetical protein